MKSCIAINHNYIFGFSTNYYIHGTTANPDELNPVIRYRGVRISGHYTYGGLLRKWQCNLLLYLHFALLFSTPSFSSFPSTLPLSYYSFVLFRVSSLYSNSSYFILHSHLVSFSSLCLFSFRLLIILFLLFLFQCPGPHACAFSIWYDSLTLW